MPAENGTLITPMKRIHTDQSFYAAVVKILCKAGDDRGPGNFTIASVMKKVMRALSFPVELYRELIRR